MVLKIGSEIGSKIGSRIGSRIGSEREREIYAIYTQSNKMTFSNLNFFISSTRSKRFLINKKRAKEFRKELF